jgi:class 3 adenylate cyclase/YHS domain-containing protein
MEQNTAILIADLSGYTALTETHGPSTAADMVEKYVAIVKDCLVGDSKLHQTIGDEVLIVSSSPDHLLNTATLLLQACSSEHLFLQLHGGLHYGKVLIRNNNYFGAPVNVASRIANKAGKGSFWCSADFVNNLSGVSTCSFSSKGKHGFKNVSEEMEVFELMIEGAASFHIDPVCRMLIHKKETAIPHPADTNIFFCSPDCLELYINSK